MATSDAIDTSNTGDECSICLISLSEPGLDIYTTACQHRFHFQCLAKNVQAQNNECPLCRTHLDSLVNTLNAIRTNIAPLAPTENTQVQQVAPIQSLAMQQPVPMPIQQTLIAQNLPPENDTGVWNTLTKPLRNAYNWFTSRSNASNSSDNYNGSKRNDPSEDLIDKNAVSELAARINAARQQASQHHAELPHITATTTLEFGAQESTKESNIYGMVTLKAPSLFTDKISEKEQDELHIPIDLICVVDQSGSMGGEKIDLLKKTLNYIVDQTSELDRLAIISFETNAYNISNGLKLMTTNKKQEIRNVIERNINADGGTYIGSGLEMAIRLLRNRQTTNPIGAMLLLTDGEDNQPHDYSKIMQRLPEGVVCHTFGYGVHHNAALLSRLAEQGHGGTFTYIDQVDAIGPAFATALGGLFTCIAKQLRIKLEFNHNYNITHTHTTYPYEPKNLPSRQVTFQMTDLNADETRNLVFQLHVPKIRPIDDNNANDQTIGYVSLEYNDPNTNQTVRTQPVPFILARPNQIDPRSPLLQVNYELDIQRNRAETAQILKQAVEETNYGRAREMINTQLTKIRSSVSANDPLCQQLIHDLEYQYSNQQEFKTTMTNMYMQHGQERATYSTVTTCSASRYMTSGQERFRKKFGS